MSNENETSLTEVVDGYTVEQAVEDYTNDIDSVFNGVLATHSRPEAKSHGYPFTSIVPFIFTKDGYAIIMAADISQHGQNIAQDQRVALFLRQSVNRANVQTAWRLTINGHSVMLDEGDESIESYYRHYPASRSYNNVHKFNFYRIEPKLIYIVQNFGKIGWIDPKDVADPCPMSEADLLSAVKHMNEDHTDSLYTYLQKAGHPCDGSRKIELVSINHRRFVIRHQGNLFSVPFAKPVKDMNELRQEMVKMSYANP